ncbi:hypothetical protein J7E70_12185 [Variovorax paradoxus]|nr:hypothetical protein [Variovorax paradoxus]MBT2301220.1 hypothetical protein [Variovorax paradoxus]
MRTDQMECAALLNGFISGWNAGIARGVRSAFVLDAEKLATTKGIDDVSARVLAVRPAAQCIGASGINFTQFMERYIAFTVARPERQQEPFYDLLTEMIENTLCRPK